MALRFNKAGKNVGLKAQNLSLGIPMPDSGVCITCGQWDSELKDGYCRDVDCKRARQLLAWSKGEAVIYNDDGNGRVKVFKR